MRSIKLSVLSVFTILAIVTLGQQFLERTVSGHSAGGSLAAPTGVSASVRQYATKVGLHWDTIRDATVYRVMRNVSDDAGSATDVGT
ncbi:MAG TPA: hypothetical protein VK468_04875, partial [Pyrinomonadaceae bacterium]|nr:hypothetical protein [Pyrinomonadaceae bacterium]